jgi:hypothetical protein
MPARRLVNVSPSGKAPQIDPRTDAIHPIHFDAAWPIAVRGRPALRPAPAAGCANAWGAEDRRLGFRRSVALVMPQAAQHCGITRAMRDMTRDLLSKPASFQEAFLKYGGTVIFLPH